MKKSLSTNGIFLGVGGAFLLLAVGFCAAVFRVSESPQVLWAAVLFSLLCLLLGVLLAVLLRRKLTAFSDALNACLDDLMSGNQTPAFGLEEETLMGKFSHKLRRLYEIMQNGKRQVQEEKRSLQELISDLSHQVKTPVTNLKMYKSTLLERCLPPEREREFCRLMGSQIDKLDFFMQAMVKMSRLETGIISLTVASAPIYDTVGLSLAGIELSAERKRIAVTVRCDPALTVPHDRKWTAEALFNLLDNAVKYTPPGGRISVTVQRWETATKIDISDTGKGIPEQHYAQIFKRFYREDDVHDAEGVGIGLSLCREIIQKQGGFVQVKSEVGKGSTFSVFLPNRA